MFFSPSYRTFVYQLPRLVTYVVDEKKKISGECTSQEKLRLFSLSLPV